MQIETWVVESDTRKIFLYQKHIYGGNSEVYLLKAALDYNGGKTNMHLFIKALQIIKKNILQETLVCKSEPEHYLVYH